MDIREGEIQAIRGYISGNVVDCGVGSNAVYTPCIGIDQFKAGSYVYGKQEWPSIANAVFDIENLPFKDETIDTIISFHTIEHLKDPLHAIKDWYRCLKKGGHLLIIVPDTEFTFGKDATHLHEWKAKDFKREVLDPAGLEPIQFDTLNNRWSFDIVVRKDA